MFEKIRSFINMTLVELWALRDEVDALIDQCIKMNTADSRYYLEVFLYTIQIELKRNWIQLAARYMPNEGIHRVYIPSPDCAAPKLLGIPNKVFEVVHELLVVYFSKNPKVIVRDNHTNGYVSKILVRALKKPWFCKIYTQDVKPIAYATVKHYCTILNEIFSKKYLNGMIVRHIKNKSHAEHLALAFKEAKAFWEAIPSDDFDTKKALWMGSAPVHRELLVIPYDKKDDNEIIQHILDDITNCSIIAVGSYASAEFVDNDSMGEDVVIESYKARRNSMHHKMTMPEDRKHVNSKISNFTIKYVSEFIPEDIVSSYGFRGMDVTTDVSTMRKYIGKYEISEQGIEVERRQDGVNSAAYAATPVTRLFKYVSQYMGHGEYVEIAKGVALGMDNFSADVQYMKLDGQKKSWKTLASINNYGYESSEIQNIVDYQKALKEAPTEIKEALLTDDPVTCSACGATHHRLAWYCPACGTENEQNPLADANPYFMEDDSEYDPESYDYDEDNPSAVSQAFTDAVERLREEHIKLLLNEEEI